MNAGSYRGFFFLATVACFVRAAGDPPTIPLGGKTRQIPPIGAERVVIPMYMHEHWLDMAREPSISPFGQRQTARPHAGPCPPAFAGHSSQHRRSVSTSPHLKENSAMVSLRGLAPIVLAVVAVGLTVVGTALAQTAPSPACSRDQAIRTAVRACPGRPISAELGRDNRWSVRIREQNQSIWIVRVNNQNCRVVPGSMRRVSS